MGQSRNLEMFVLVNDAGAGWYDMSVDPNRIAVINHPDTHVEKWVYNTIDGEDILIDKQTLCQTCYMYQNPGQIWNASQWVSCHSCRGNKSEK